MPYVITTRTLTDEIDEDGLIVDRDYVDTRTAVATLDEAREAARAMCDGPGEQTIRSAVSTIVGPDGGTIGPLPDGTVIEVRPIERFNAR